MKKAILSAAAISAFALATPVLAQSASSTSPQQNGTYQNGGYANNNISTRIAQLDQRFQAGIQSGAITRREAVPLRQQLRQLTQLERQYSANGLTPQERQTLQQRVRTLRQQLRIADDNAQGRYAQYDRDDDYSQNGQYNDQYSSRVDANNDGWDDRDTNRNGRWDDDRNTGNYDNRDDYDRDDDGYQQPVQRGGLGGIVDRVLGTNSGGLRVGQQASGNLYGVPDEYRSQYRDGNGSYYRSDGRSIYQIDTRTQSVVRVYPMNR